MSIKSQGGVFGRNPTFNDVTVEGDLSIAGTLSVGGETITGLSYQGGWNASTNTPDIAASGPVTGQFWIVSADGATNVGGITNWTQGDWALYDGSNWQRVEGGNTDLSTGVQGQLAVANGGTGAADASTARTNLGLGTAATTAATDYATAAQGALADSALQSSDIGVSVQGYDANILTSSDIGSTVQGYDANILTSSDIGVSVQGYDADTAKLDATQSWSATQNFSSITVDGLTVDDAIVQLKQSSAGNNIVRFTENSVINNHIGTDGAGSFHITGASFSSGKIASFDGSSKNITTYGNVILPNGSGIDFSATSGTGTSELLDDYEEGNWGPTLFGSTTAGTIPYAYSVGRYVKVGNLVTVWGRVRPNTPSVQPTGNLYVGGLPFVAQDSSNNYGPVTIGRTVSWGTQAPEGGYVYRNTDYIVLQRKGTADNMDQYIDAGILANADDLIFSCVYKA